MSLDVSKKSLDWAQASLGEKADFLLWPSSNDLSCHLHSIVCQAGSGPPYIYHHSQWVMIQASQGDAAEGPDIFISRPQEFQCPTHT